MNTLFDNHGWIVLEQKPTCRTISMDSWRRANYFLSFPYIIFAHNPSRLNFRVGFFNEKQEVSDDPSKFQYFVPPLPNFYETGEVCLGDRVNLKETTNELIDLFWNTEFSNDDGWPGVDEAKKIFNSKSPYDVWEEKSKLNPNFGITVPWRGLVLGLGYVWDNIIKDQKKD